MVVYLFLRQLCTSLFHWRAFRNVVFRNVMLRLFSGRKRIPFITNSCSLSCFSFCLSITILNIFSFCCPRCGHAEETINHMVFTCPPATQCWALSTIPSAPGIFPSPNLYTNINYLLSRINIGGTMEELTKVFPWLIWYIWKARNEKLYNGRDLAPRDTTELAVRECNAWFLANEEIDPCVSVTDPIPVDPPDLPIFICRVDGSWKNDGATSGVGWILQLQDGSIDLLGLHGCHKQISPLHTELKSLIWALKCLSRHQRFCDYFVTDSQELVKMISTPEDWPAFAAELNEFKSLWESYQDGKVVYQPRSSNVQADFLARQARTRNRVFSYVNTAVPHWIDTSNSSFSDLY